MCVISPRVTSHRSRSSRQDTLEEETGHDAHDYHCYAETLLHRNTDDRLAAEQAATRRSWGAIARSRSCSRWSWLRLRRSGYSFSEKILVTSPWGLSGATDDLQLPVVGSVWSARECASPTTKEESKEWRKDERRDGRTEEGKQRPSCIVESIFRRVGRKARWPDRAFFG